MGWENLFLGWEYKKKRKKKFYIYIRSNILMFLKETNKKIVILSKTGLNIESLYKNWMEVVIFSCVVPLRKESAMITVILN